jgi:hypothetical protein
MGLYVLLGNQQKKCPERHTKKLCDRYFSGESKKSKHGLQNVEIFRNHIIGNQQVDGLHFCKSVNRVQRF